MHSTTAQKILIFNTTVRISCTMLMLSSQGNQIITRFIIAPNYTIFKILLSQNFPHKNLIQNNNN